MFKMFTILVLLLYYSRINSLSLPELEGANNELETGHHSVERSKFITPFKDSEEALGAYENFTYEKCDKNTSFATYPLKLVYLSLNPYPLDFKASVTVYYKVALIKPLVEPAMLYLTLNLGFMDFTKKLDFCSMLEMENLGCPLDKGVFEGKFKLSLRPYQIYGKNLNKVWANMRLYSGDDEEKFLCIKFRIRTKQTPYLIS